jgi:crotonobetainyl-CoA:carnitine CoA-transferase CaiB-like acyl-CoA transferase
MNLNATPALTGDDAPLDGYVVVDFTRVLAGPYCTRLLADLGATVIKIERPGEGDETRYITPQLNPERNDQSAYFARLNAGKQSIAIDFTKPAARELVFDMVRKADVVIENFSPGVMKKYGFDEPSLRLVKPDIVYCAVSGFGQTGPLHSLQAYAHLINAISGMMELDTGGIAQPRASNLQAADVLAGGQAFGAICAALLRRARHGTGAFIDVSMLECLIAADDINFPALLNENPAPRRPRFGMIVQPIGERHIAMQIGGAPAMWPRLCQLMKQPELENDPRFATPADRRGNWSTLSKIVGDWLAGFANADEALETLSAARIPSVPMLNPEEIVEHPQMQERGAFPSVAHPVSGAARVTATPFQIDGKAITPASSVPYLIGQHSRDVIDWLGYPAEKATELIEAEVVVSAA